MGNFTFYPPTPKSRWGGTVESVAELATKLFEGRTDEQHVTISCEFSYMFAVAKFFDLTVPMLRREDEVEIAQDVKMTMTWNSIDGRSTDWMMLEGFATCQQTVEFLQKLFSHSPFDDGRDVTVTVRREKPKTLFELSQEKEPHQ